MRITYEHQLAEIERDTLVLANMVERAVATAVESLRAADPELSGRVVDDDLKINRKRYDIEEKCIEIIATQQPTAGDLRLLASVLYVIADLERIGDHAEGIAKAAVGLGAVPPAHNFAELLAMNAIGSEMLTGALDALRRRDTALARAICQRDDDVDRLHDNVYEHVLADVALGSISWSAATRLTWISHHLERIADRATNICERVVYIVEGKVEELNISKY